MENIDKIYKFFVIHQNLSYQTFLLAIAKVALATVLIHQIFLNANIFPCKIYTIRYNKLKIKQKLQQVKNLPVNSFV